MNTQVPNLGTTWKEAIQSAYMCGYDAWKHSHAGLIEEARSMKNDVGRRDAQHILINDGKTAIINEDQDYRRFCWAIGDFYEDHMSDELEQQYKRAEAVAEDIHVAYEAGAWDAIFGAERDVSNVSHFYGE